MWIMFSLFVNNSLTRWVKFEVLFWVLNFEDFTLFISII